MIAMEVQNNINVNNYSIQCQALEYRSPTIPPSTGIGFLDHMLEQLYSHAQIGIDLQIQKNTIISTTSVVPIITTVHPSTTTTTTPGGGMDKHNHSDSSQKNRYAHLVDQTEFLALVGTAVGTALTTLQQEKWKESNSSSHSHSNSRRTSTFACPLDEALTICILEQQMNGISSSSSSSSSNSAKTTTTTDMVEGRLVSYTLPPYGIYPKPTGRTCIGTLQTKAMESFWIHLAKAMPNLTIQLLKVRGNNAHHIVESSFKAFARAIRNLFDGIDTVVHGRNGPDDDASSLLLQNMYGPTSINYITSMNLHRKASIVRTTKETSIRTDIQFDGGQTGIQIHTGIVTLDQFLYEMARMANISLHVTCQGDLWIDEHHTAEDVAISIGQVMYEALGTKAGLNRMWYASSNVVDDDDDNNVDYDNSHHKIHVTMDLSNRPCFTHNLHSLETVEMIGDLTCEMLEHVLDSIVINARMTVHIVEEVTGQQRHEDVVVVRNVMMATARAFGQALNYCSLVDIRRAGATASSKGTLSA
jgi:imidazoleglycerol-phosphate dehydratase